MKTVKDQIEKEDEETNKEIKKKQIESKDKETNKDIKKDEESYFIENVIAEDKDKQINEKDKEID